MVDIITRAQWQAAPPTKITRFQLPASVLVIHHLATDAWHGASGMRSCQRFHQSLGWRDFAYTFAADEDGRIYEGTGPDVVGTHTKGWNFQAAAIVAMGNFADREPPPAMVDSIVALIRHGRREGWWGNRILGHRDAPGAQTACCGDQLYRMLPRIRHLATLNEEDEMDPEDRADLQETKRLAQNVNHHVAGPDFDPSELPLRALVEQIAADLAEVKTRLAVPRETPGW